MVKMYSPAAGAGCCFDVCGTNVEVTLGHLKVSVVVGNDHSFTLL